MDFVPHSLDEAELPRAGAAPGPGAPPAAATPQPLLHAALDALPHMVWLGNTLGEALYVNTAWQHFCQGHAPTGAPPPWLAQLHPEDSAALLPIWEQALTSHALLQGQYRLQHHGLGYRWCLLLAQFQSSAGHWYLTCTDIHNQVLAQQTQALQLLRHKTLLDVSVDCIKILRPDGTLQHMNRTGCHTLGVPEGSDFGMQWLDLLPASVRSQGRRALQAAQQGRNARFGGMSPATDKPALYWDNILTPLPALPQGYPAILCVSRDVTQQRQAQERLRHQSEHDALTGLPNRRAFNARLRRDLCAAREAGQVLGLMLLDLDHFKHVNDTMGHAGGDHLLKVLSRRLQACLPPAAFVARLGGDEFAIVTGPMDGKRGLDHMSATVLAQLKTPITYAGQPIQGGMSIGCALFPRDASDAQSLLKCADTALHDLKAGGRGGARMFCSRMMDAAQQSARQLQRARQVVREDSIEPHYQAKVRLRDKVVVGFEALLRWHSKSEGLQLPDTVLAAFQDYALATRLGELMRSKVFADMLAWQRAGLVLLPVSLNAAPVEFLRDDYAERLLAQLQLHAIAPQLLELEVTEHMLGERGAAYVIRALQLLKNAGVRIALDDFGTGHSSLTHLLDYPVDCLKVDREFVRCLDDKPAILAIVKAIGQLGPSLSLDIVAEGIETEEQRRTLIEAGYHIGQGFLFGQAMSAHEVAQTLGHPQRSPSDPAQARSWPGAPWGSGGGEFW